MSTFAPIVCLLLAALAAPGLRAEDPETTHHWRWKHSRDTEFAWQAQLDLPLKDLGSALDHRSGLGLGVQWNHDHGDGHASRTRLEWNVFPESNAVGLPGLKTKSSNYILSFDRLYHFSGRRQGPYLLAGLGGVRWFMDRSASPNPAQSFHVTKLAITAGAGYRFNPSFSAECRYLLSNVTTHFDGNMLQAGLNLRF